MKPSDNFFIFIFIACSVTQESMRGHSWRPICADYQDSGDGFEHRTLTGTLICRQVYMK